MTSSILKQKKGKFYIEGVSLDSIINTYETPSYIYSKKIILDNFNNFQSFFKNKDHLICFSVKSNSNLAILNLLAKSGAGFDIVSGGELQRVISAKGDPKKIVFSGVGKTIDEIKLAIQNDILAFNVESEPELLRIQEIAKSLNKKASISIRVNPNVDAKTHPYISTGLKDNKFGIDEKKAIELYKKANALDSIIIKGIDCHIGSQITELAPFIDSVKKLINLIEQLKFININIEHIDIGGGIGINYRKETPPTFSKYAQAICALIKDKNLKIIFEPGRALIGKAGLLLTQVEYIKNNKDKNFAIMNTAMNDLMRPALYDAFHEIINLSVPQTKQSVYDIVGPICETADFLGKDRVMSIDPGNFLAILDTGAYGMTMSSNYNSRPRISELMVDKNHIYEIKKRETYSDLIQGEIFLPE